MQKLAGRGKIENKDAKGTAHYPGWSLPALGFLVVKNVLGRVDRKSRNERR